MARILLYCLIPVLLLTDSLQAQEPKNAAQLRAENLAKRAGKDAKKTEEPQPHPDPATVHLSTFEIQDQQKPKQKVIVSPDRTVFRALEQAKQLAERDRVPEAVRMIGTILEGNDDFFFEQEENAGRITNRTFKRAAEELLLSLPEEGRRMYAMNNDPLALRLLKNAVETGSVDLLEKIVDSYFYTESGNTAAFLLAMNRYDQGARASALLLFRRLAKEAQSLDAYEPTFSLTFASCELALGHSEETQKILEDFLRRHPNPKIRVANNEIWTPTTAEEILKKLNSGNSLPDIAEWIEFSGWLTSSGTPAQNTQVQASPPLLELLWKLPTITQPKLYGIIRLIEGQMRRTQSTFIPTARPVVVGNTLVFQAQDTLIGVNALNGKRVWIGKAPEYQTQIFGKANRQIHNPYGQNMNQWLANLLRLQIWHNPATGSPASDGRLVFNIEEIPDASPFSMNQIRAMGGRPGSTQYEDPRGKFSTTLTARDAHTGEVVWRVGKSVFVQKQLAFIEEQIEAERKKNQQGLPKATLPSVLPPGRNIHIKPMPNPPPAPAAPKKDEPKDDKNDEKIIDVKKADPFARAEAPQQEETETEEEPEPEEIESKIQITPEERLLGDTYFLGPPLAVLGNLFVLGENGGVIRLFVFETQSGKLIRHIGLLEPGNPLDSDLLRRFRGSSPAYNEGILVCPTASGAVFALDAASGKLVWCYTYADQVEEPEGNQQRLQRRMGMMGQFPFNLNGQMDEYQYLVDYVGWQIPSTSIEDGKLIFAPADRPMLYCFDLLTGELLWKRSKGKGRYVACIHSGKVVVVAQDSLAALDLNTGKSLWNDQGIAPLPDVTVNTMQGRTVRPAAAPQPANREEVKSKSSLPHVAFPKNAFPSGVGVQFGKEYMIPMSDRSILVVDLESAKIVRSWQSFDSSKPGNLVAIGGRIFSQSATELLCFHQFEKLRTGALEALQLNPNDSEAILNLGRLAYVEGNCDEAIQLLRKAIALNSNPQNRNTMRLILTEAMRSDFEKYRISLDEIEKLQDEPGSLVPLLHAFIQGCVKTRDHGHFIVAFRKIMALDQQEQHLIPSRDEGLLSLTRWIRLQVEQFSKVPELSEFLDSLAKEEFERIAALSHGVPDNESELTRAQWKKYLEYFESNSLSRDARRELVRLLEKDRQISELEFLLNLPLQDRLASWKEPSDELLRENIKKSNLENHKSLPEWEIVTKDLPSRVEDDERILTKTLALLDVKKEPKKNEPETASPDSASQNPASSNSPVPDSDGKAAEIYRVARSFAESGDLESAVHYDRLLATRFANVQFSAPSTGETMTGANVLERLSSDPKFQPYLYAKHWPDKRIDFPNRSPDEDAKFRSEYFANLGNSHAVYQNMYFNPYDNLARNFNTIPLVDDYSPFFLGCSFSVQINENNLPLLTCWDQSGRKKWSADISQRSSEEHDGINNTMYYGNDAFAYTGTTGFLRACNHVIYYTQGKRILAIDTLKRDKFGRASILWARSLQSAFGPIRIFKRALRVQMLNSSLYVNPYDSSQSGNSLCVLPNVVCFQDLDRLYGVDPLTGEVLWSKESLAYQSVLTGDDQYVYQIRPVDGQNMTPGLRNAYSNSNIPRSYEVVVLNGDTGEEELKQALSFLPIHCFGSRVVTCTTRINTNDQRIDVYDLRDIVALKKQSREDDSNAELTPEQKRKKALSTDTGNLSGTPTQIPGNPANLRTSINSLKPRFSSKGLNHYALINFAGNGRILTVLTQGRELLLFDLATLEPYGNMKQAYISRSDLERPHEIPSPNTNQYNDFHLEFDNGEFLAVLVWDTNINSNILSPGTPGPRQTRSVLPSFTQRSIGRGTVMRYSMEGKPMWAKAHSITNWQLLEFPSLIHSPVLLFGAQVNERNTGNDKAKPVIWGLNKKTGERVFGKMFDFSENARNANMGGLFHNFIRVFVDPANDALVFTTPTWSVWGIFRDQEETPPEETDESSDAEKTADDSQEEQSAKQFPKRSFVPGLMRAFRNQFPNDIQIQLEHIPDMLEHWE